MAGPFDTKRWSIMRNLYYTQMIPQTEEEILAYEVGEVDWRQDLLKSLAGVGAGLRLLALILFYFRSNYQVDGLARHLMISIRLRVAQCCCCLSRREAQALPPGATLKHLESRLPRSSAVGLTAAVAHTSSSALDPPDSELAGLTRTSRLQSASRLSLQRQSSAEASASAKDSLRSTRL
jgi:hypothetical protein